MKRIKTNKMVFVQPQTQMGFGGGGCKEKGLGKGVRGKSGGF